MLIPRVAPLVLLPFPSGKNIMTLLTTLLLLLSLPLASYGPGDGPDKDGPDKKEKSEQRAEAAPLDYVPAVSGIPATDYTTRNLVGSGAQVWASFGYGYTERYFDNDSDLQDLGAVSVPGVGEVDTEARLTSYILHVGGSYDVSQIGDMNISLGADLGLAQREATADAAGPLPETDASSGFAPQNLTLFGKISRPAYTLRGGYLFDLGPEAEDAEDYENTDQQNAVLLGLSGKYPFTNTVRFFGGVDYFLTLKGDDNDVEFDEGDLIALHAGVGYNFGVAEIGVTGLYRINTEGEYDGTDGDDVGTVLEGGVVTPGTPNIYASGNSFGLVPYLNYTPQDANFQVTLKGAVQTEYFDYGYTVAGKNDIAPRLGFTLGVKYGL